MKSKKNPKRQTCLVTGGAGFIGSHIVDELIDRGYRVVVLDNLRTGKREHINPQAALHEADITKDIRHVFEQEKPDIVIHTAAQVMLRDSFDDPVFDAMTNIIGTIKVLEACRKHGVKKIIYTATGGARVGEPEYLPVDENHPIKPSSPYGISKHTAEHYIEMYGQVYGLDHLIFCFGNVYGPRDDERCKRVIAVFTRAMLNGQPPTIFGDGEQTRDFIYVKDIADFIVESINKQPEHRLFHLANSEQISINRLVEILKPLCGFDGEIKRIEAIKGEVHDMLLDTTRAKTELGWKPGYSFKQGLAETVEWFKKQS